MVTAINEAIVAGVNGIATTLIDPVAFNTPVDNALSKGIPVIAYNADEAGNNRMAYVGQNNLTAGAAAANRIVSSGVVSKGDLVAGVIATPGTGNIQPRIDGAKPIFENGRLQFQGNRYQRHPGPGGTAARAVVPGQQGRQVHVLRRLG